MLPQFFLLEFCAAVKIFILTTISILNFPTSYFPFISPFRFASNGEKKYHSVVLQMYHHMSNHIILSLL